MELANLKPADGAKQSKNFRRGRGHGSGNGKTAGNRRTYHHNHDGEEVTIEALLNKGIIKKINDGVKVLGNGELTKKLNVKLTAFSASAKEKIEALGGTCEVI